LVKRSGVDRATDAIAKRFGSSAIGRARTIRKK
jgi:hypothetical protein